MRAFSWRRQICVWATCVWIATGCASSTKLHVGEKSQAANTEAIASLVAEFYRVVETKDPSRLESLVSGNCFAFGMAPDDMFSSRTEIVQWVRSTLNLRASSGAQLRFTQSAPLIGVSDDTKTAWLFDQPALSITTGDRQVVIQLRVTAYAERQENDWRLGALHVSAGVSDSMISSPDAIRRFAPPKSLSADEGAHTEQLRGLTRRMLESLKVKVESVSDLSTVAIVGTDPREVFIDGQKFKSVARTRLSQIEASAYQLRIDGPMNARTIDHGKSGWVAANVVLRTTQKGHVQTLTPFRALFIFADEEGRLTLVSEHQSVGMSVSQLEAVSKPAKRVRDGSTDPAPEIDVWE